MNHFLVAEKAVEGKVPPYYEFNLSTGDLCCGAAPGVVNLPVGGKSYILALRAQVPLSVTGGAFTSDSTGTSHGGIPGLAHLQRRQQPLRCPCGFFLKRPSIPFLLRSRMFKISELLMTSSPISRQTLWLEPLKVLPVLFY